MLHEGIEEIAGVGKSRTRTAETQGREQTLGIEKWP